MCQPIYPKEGCIILIRKAVFALAIFLLLTPNLVAGISLTGLGSYETGVFDEGAAEIVAHDPAIQRVFFINGDGDSDDILDISTPAAPAFVSSIEVSMTDGVVAVALENGDDEAAKGLAAFFAADGTPLEFDDGDDFERITGAQIPANFNSNNDENSFENRSDDMGPEPEAIACGEIGGNAYGFIGLGRVGGIMVYDISDPYNSKFVLYENNRNFIADVKTPASGDLAPESITFIKASDSPAGKAMIVVGREVCGTVTLYEADWDEIKSGGIRVNSRRPLFAH